MNGNDARYTEWSTDVKLFPLSYNSQITTTLGMSPYEMVLNQKPRKQIMFTANAHKNAQGHCKPNKDSICYNLPLHTHDEDNFHHPQILKLASGTHTEWILNRDKKHTTVLKIGTFVLVPNFQTQKGNSKKLQPLRKGPYQIIAKPTEVTYKLIDTTKKKIVQHRNNLLPYYPKEYALRELTQLHSFTGLKIIQNSTQIEPEMNGTNKNQHTQIQKQDKIHKNANTLNSNNLRKERNRKMIEKILPQEQKEKSTHRESSRLRNQPRKDYKTFIPQSKILKKDKIQK